jgi:hypothetical protein
VLDKARVCTQIMNVFSLAKAVARGDQAILDSQSEMKSEPQADSAPIQNQNQIQLRNQDEDLEMPMDDAAAALDSLLELVDSMGKDGWGPRPLAKSRGSSILWVRMGGGPGHWPNPGARRFYG